MADRIAALADRDRKKRPALHTRAAWAINAALAGVRASCIAGAKRALRGAAGASARKLISETAKP